MNATPAATQAVAELTVEGPSGSRRRHRLSADDQVLVGASDHCGLQIQDPDVSSYHCVISLENGSVWIQEWSSAAETRVNGEPVSGKTRLEAGDQLSVGQHRLVARLIPAAVPTESPAEIPAEAPIETTDSRLSGQSAESSPPGGPDEQAAEPTTAETETGEDDWFGTAEASPAWPAELAISADPFAGETVDAETVSLLRAEIEDLRAALAQRDAAADDFSAADPDAPQDDSPHAADHERLLERLDQLLQEAECSDERIAVLEELLHTAEQANQAGQEERHQLQQWIGDIENRIGQREAEWQAEIEAYQSQLAEAHRQRDAAQGQLRQAAQQRGAAAEAQQYAEAIERLQQQNQQLQQTLADANKERAALKQQVEQGDTRSDQELRAERAEIAQQRAEVSRLRHELSSKLAALEEMPEPKEQPDGEFTGRLQALREHLREIHAQEKQEREQRESTLTGRLSRLWNRLES